MSLPSPAGVSRVAFSIAVPVERFNQLVDVTLLESARRFRADLSELLSASEPLNPGTTPAAASS
jgi:hypothetical protein